MDVMDLLQRMGAPSDQHVWTQKRANGANVGIVLTEVQSIRVTLRSNFCVIVDDEAGSIFAEPWCQSVRCLLNLRNTPVFGAKLYGRAARGSQRDPLGYRVSVGSVGDSIQA